MSWSFIDPGEPVRIPIMVSKADLDQGSTGEQFVTRVDHNYKPDDITPVGRNDECMTFARAMRYHKKRRVFLDGNKKVFFHGA